MNPFRFSRLTPFLAFLQSRRGSPARNGGNSPIAVGKPEGHAEAGQMGWSRVDWVRVYGGAEN